MPLPMTPMSMPLPLGHLSGVLRPPSGPATGATIGASLHSSNDSGFSNEPPAAPEIDYSDDEPSRWVPQAGREAVAAMTAVAGNASVPHWIAPSGRLHH